MNASYDPGSLSFETVVVFANFKQLSQQRSTTTKSSIAASTTAASQLPQILRTRQTKTVQPSYHRNQQYSIIGLTNAAGTLVERYTYSAYGTLGIYAANGTARTTSTYANRYTYTGREYDADLNLYHFRARWYDPATGGFISRDPLGFVDGMSLYRGYFGVESVDSEGTLSRQPKDSKGNFWEATFAIGALILPKTFDCECICSVQSSACGGNSFGCSTLKETVTAFGYVSASQQCSSKCVAKGFHHTFPQGFTSRSCTGRLKGLVGVCSLLDNYCLNQNLTYKETLKCLMESRQLCKCIRASLDSIGERGIHRFSFLGNVCTECSSIFFSTCLPVPGEKFKYFNIPSQSELGGSRRPTDYLGWFGTHGHTWHLIEGNKRPDNVVLPDGGCAIATIDFWNDAPAFGPPIVPDDWWGPGQDPFRYKDNKGRPFPTYKPKGWLLW